MKEWMETKLGAAPLQIIDGDRGRHYPKQDEFTASGHCLFLSARNVTSTGFDFAETQFISAARDNLLRKGRLERTDTVLTTRGTVGNVAFFNGAVPFDRMRINSGMVILRPEPAQLSPEFNYYLFVSLKRAFADFASGSAQPQLPIRDLSEIPILLPPLPEQKAIASVLSSLDDKIDLLHRQNKTLEAMAETLFRQWFVEEADDSVVPLGEFAENIRDGVRAENLDAFEHYVGLEHIPRKRLYLDEWGTPEGLGSNKSVFRKGDILFGKLRPYFHKVVVAPIAGVCSTDVLVIRAKAEHFALFCLLWFFSKEVVDFSDAGSGGTRMPRTSWEMLASYEVPKPDYQRLAEFNETVRPILEKMTSSVRQIRTLVQLRDTLLPKLMSGEVRVAV
ncbi:MAG: restriction endonuclease subunit S [Leptospirales bacterium]|nr:restriction endonuclease subunit S [Leptospirales bacterium]